MAEEYEQELVITRGLPGSGKSTAALEWVAQDPERRVRVNRDDLRLQIHGVHTVLDEDGKPSVKAENKVTDVEFRLIEQALKQGKSVISDNTHLSPSRVKKYTAIARRRKIEARAWDFPISLEEAKRRNANRERVVPEHVLDRMHSRLGPKGQFHYFDGSYTPRTFVKPTSRRAGLIVDLDGTLCDVRPIRHFVRDGRRNFDLFHRSSYFCDPNPEVLRMVRDAEAREIPILIVSARMEQYREVSEVWLNSIDVIPENMYLRPDSDSRPDYEAKQDILKKIQKHYDIYRAIDDNPAVRDLWKRNDIATTIVPGFSDGEVGEDEVIQIDNVFDRGGCVRCGKPLKNGGFIGPRCAQF